MADEGPRPVKSAARPAGGGPAAAAGPVPRLLSRYRQTVRPALMERFGYRNPYAAARLTKIVVSAGIGEAVNDVKFLEQAAQELALITGQRPVMTRAKKAISNFKLKKGQPIGLKVTLRRERMYEFLDRLTSVAMPRIRDFRGLRPERGFDGAGNFALGLTEQLIFPEVDYDNVVRVQGMNVVICTTARNRQEALALLKGLGVPFREE